MKTKKLKKRSFVGAIALLVISAITLTTSTFAWFSMGPKVEVQAMDLTVSSVDGIQISANAAEWDSYLSVAEIFDNFSEYGDVPERAAMIAYSGNHNLYPEELVPVSSAFNGLDSNGYANFYRVQLGATTGTARLVSQTGEAQDAGFVAFDLFLRTSKDQTVYFDESVFSNKEGSDELKSTAALRVAFQNMGQVAFDADASTATGISGGNTTTMYEPDSELRSDDAANKAEQSAGVKTTQYVLDAGEGLALDTTNKVLTAGVGNSSATAIVNTAEAANKTFDIQAGITKLRVYIWMEGNDIDCRDSIGTDEITAALSFSIEAPDARTV